MFHLVLVYATIVYYDMMVRMVRTHDIPPNYFNRIIYITIKKKVTSVAHSTSEHRIII